MINSVSKFRGIPFFLMTLITLSSLLTIDAQEDSSHIIINKGDQWSYHDDIYLDTKKWIEQQFLPSSEWKTGKAPFGYNYKDLNTIISYGKDSTEKIITSYYHKTFFIEKASDFYAYNLNIKRDDGAIIYLNGKEVWRTNMPNINKLNHKTKAEKRIDGEKENKFHTKVLFPNNFLNGINIIAVEVHQISTKTSDCIFDLELKGTNDLAYLKDFLINQDLQNLELKEEIKELNYRIELEKKDKELKSLNTRKSIIDILLIISILALLTSIVFLSLLIRDKIKSKEQIRDIKDSLMLKEKEMLNISLRNIQSKQQVELVKSDLETIIESSETRDKKNTISELKNLHKILQHNINNEDEWGELQRHFNLVHSGFFTRLVKKHPSLAQSELRHCSLIKLQLSTKEIAKYLYISPKSVQASRYRIKKKMQLNEAVDLKNYLLNF